MAHSGESQVAADRAGAVAVCVFAHQRKHAGRASALPRDLALRRQVHLQPVGEQARRIRGGYRRAEEVALGLVALHHAQEREL